MVANNDGSLSFNVVEESKHDSVPNKEFVSAVVESESKILVKEKVMSTTLKESEQIDFLKLDEKKYENLVDFVFGFARAHFSE